jgi:hypothetical protein
MTAKLEDPRLFQDYDDEEIRNPDTLADETTEDRDIVHGLWLKCTSGPDLNLLRFPDYFVLFDRYPKETRFLILALYRRIDEDEHLVLIPNSDSHSDLLKQIEQVSRLSDATLGRFASDLLALLKYSWQGESTEIDAFQSRTNLRATPNAQEALASLDALEKNTLLWAHDKTLGRAPLGNRPTKTASPSEMSFQELFARYGQREPKPYDPSLTPSVGDVISHPAFGRGIVAQCLGEKAWISFPSGKKLLKVKA